MKFSLADLESFVAVADASSFRRAAENVHVSQPALSRRIAKLEQALGVRLFERTTRTVSLTAVGREFAHRARELLADLEQTLLGMEDIATTRGGEVTVACVPSAAYYYLPRFIRVFHDRYPRIRVRVIDETANTVLASVIRGEADFGLNFVGTQEPEVEFESRLEETFVVACRRDHPLAGKRRVTWAELGRHDYMTVSKSSGNRMLIDLALARAGERPRWFYETRHVSTLLGLVEAGLGVAAVPRLALPAEDHPTIATIPLVQPGLTRTLGLIRRRGRELSPSASALYELLLPVRAVGRKSRRGSAARSGNS